MNTYSIDRLQPLTIGRVGDQEVVQIPIDCTPWMQKYPALTTWYIQAMTPDGELYMPTVTMNGNVLIWNITEQDTVQAGYGEYWVVAEGMDGMKKTSASPPFIVLGEKRSASQGGSNDGNTEGGSCNCDSEALRKEFDGLVTDAEIAAARAESAANRAEDTADLVEDTSVVAEGAAERAQTFAALAEQSASLAQDTTTRAKIAAENANNASGRAETAALQANEAKTSAEVSAESARESAELAQGAAGGFGNVLVIHGGKAVFPDE